MPGPAFPNLCQVLLSQTYARSLPPITVPGPGTYDPKITQLIKVWGVETQDLGTEMITLMI